LVKIQHRPVLNLSQQIVRVQLFPVAASKVEPNGDNHETDDYDDISKHADIQVCIAGENLPRSGVQHASIRHHFEESHAVDVVLAVVATQKLEHLVLLPLAGLLVAHVAVLFGGELYLRVVLVFRYVAVQSVVDLVKRNTMVIVLL
jgi:hypothetical protein